MTIIIMTIITTIIITVLHTVKAIGEFRGDSELCPSRPLDLKLTESHIRIAIPDRFFAAILLRGENQRAKSSAFGQTLGYKLGSGRSFNEGHRYRLVTKVFGEGIHCVYLSENESELYMVL